MKSIIKKGWIKEELSEYNIVVDDDFYISIEAIKGWQSINNKNTLNAKIVISGTIDKGESYNREFSLGYWRKTNSELAYYLIVQ